MTTHAEAWLVSLLARHRARYDYLYQGWLSDHGPMTLLALSGLGADRRHIEAFADTYERRLDPLPAVGASISRDNYPDSMGDAKAYPALIGFFDEEIKLRGWRETVAHYLPPLATGWVKDALHGTIRLAYGVEFEVQSEIAAGLAYLTVIGPDPRLAAAATTAPKRSGVSPLLRPTRRDATIQDGVFNHRYAQAVESAAFHDALTVPPDPWQSLPHEALGVFASTHNFFALHLVTGTHAFRVLAPFVPDNEALLAAGLLAAYIALDQPPWSPAADNGDRLTSLDLARTQDEHDIKVAYSCLAHARVLEAPVFESVATGYLAPRLDHQP